MKLVSKFPIPGNDCGYIVLNNARYEFWPMRRYAKRRSRRDVPLFLHRIRERLRAETSVCLLCGKPTHEHTTDLFCP